jgi:hypothetical protein
LLSEWSAPDNAAGAPEPKLPSGCTVRSGAAEQSPKTASERIWWTQVAKTWEEPPKKVRGRENEIGFELLQVKIFSTLDSIF